MYIAEVERESLLYWWGLVKLKPFSVAVKIMIDFDFDFVLGLETALSLEHERLIACFVVAANQPQ